MIRFKAYLIEARRNAHLDIQKRSNALETLSKYKDDPSIHISYTKLNKVGINPKSKFPDTPLAVYTYPLKEIWSDIEKEGVANVHFAAANSKYIQVIKEKKKPLLDVSRYTVNMLKADLGKISKKISSDIIDASINDLANRGFDDNAKKNKPFLYLRVLLYTIGNKLKNRNAAAFMSVQLLDLGYSGFSDKKGLGEIHSAEPIQAFFLSKNFYDVVDIIEIKSIDLKDMNRRNIAAYLKANAKKMSDEEILNAVAEDPELLKYAGPPRTEVLKKIIYMKGRPEIWKTNNYKSDKDYDSSNDDYDAAEASFLGSGVLMLYKTLPKDFISWAIEKNFTPIRGWIKRNNYKLESKVVDLAMLRDQNSIELYDKVDLRVAKLYYSKWKDIGALIQRMNDSDLEKFLSTVDYELPDFMNYNKVVAEDLYKKLMSKKNPNEDDIIKTAGFIQKSGPIRKVPMELVDGLKKKFPDFDFTMVGGWDFWKR